MNAHLPSYALLFVLSLTLAVCAQPAPAQAPEGPPTVLGTVVSVRHSATASGILVEPGDGACGIQAVVDAETRVLRRSASGALAEVGVGAEGVGAIAEGDTAEVYAERPVMESCPLQGRAGTVVLVTPGGAPSR